MRARSGRAVCWTFAPARCWWSKPGKSALHTRCQRDFAVRLSVVGDQSRRLGNNDCPLIRFLSLQTRSHCTMRTFLVLLLQLLLLAPPVFAQTAIIDGFSAERAVAQRRWEEQFRAVPAPKSAREHLRRLTLEPHIAGTKEDYA